MSVDNLGEFPHAQHPQQMRRPARDAWLGAILTVLGTFPVAAVVALLFRFPVPFSGYQSGFEAMLISPLAVAVYGIFTGGFVVLALIGALLGWMLNRLGESDSGTILNAALAVDTAVILLLSVWDKIYGPW